MLKRIECKDREEWLAQRYRGIGGSEASAAIGLSPWMNPIQLWKLKTRRAMPQDLSDNTAVQEGIAYEPILREYFKATHADQYELWYHATDILYQDDCPYIFSTLDAELCDQSGRMGVLEIKNIQITNKATFEKWQHGKMPDYYYVQLIEQLIATQYDFSILFAALHFMNGDTTLRQYEIEKSEVLDDMNWLKPQLATFWGYVERDIMPPMPLIL